MPEKSVTVNRTLVGVIAVACLCAGLAIGVVDSLANLWCGAFVRVGLVTGALWIALPSRGRDAAWANISPLTLVVVILGALVVARRPKVFFPLLVVFGILGLFLRPRGRQRRRAQPPRETETPRRADNANG